jgi:hypothetical protein
MTRGKEGVLILDAANGLADRAVVSLLRTCNSLRLAYERSVLATNPAAAREHSNRCDSITNWRLALVRRQDPARLPPNPRHWQALAKLVGVSADVDSLENHYLQTSQSRPALCESKTAQLSTIGEPDLTSRLSLELVRGQGPRHCKSSHGGFRECATRVSCLFPQSGHEMLGQL